MYFVVVHLEGCSRKVPMRKDKIKDSFKEIRYCEDSIKDLILHKSWD